MRDKYHLYLTNEERRTVIGCLIELRNHLLYQGKYTDVIDKLLAKFTKARIKRTNVKEV